MEKPAMGLDEVEANVEKEAESVIMAGENRSRSSMEETMNSLTEKMERQEKMLRTMANKIDELVLLTNDAYTIAKSCSDCNIIASTITIPLESQVSIGKRKRVDEPLMTKSLPRRLCLDPLPADMFSRVVDEDEEAEDEDTL